MQDKNKINIAHNKSKLHAMYPTVPKNIPWYWGQVMQNL